MSIKIVSDLQVLLTKLDRLHGLSDQDRIALRGLPLDSAIVAAGDSIVQADDRADRCAIVLEGLAFSYKLTSDGRRQISCLHLAGDMPDLQSLHFGTTDTNVATISQCHGC